jgi:CubicO group peptidase (beta-lactamase class C family)
MNQALRSLAVGLLLIASGVSPAMAVDDPASLPRSSPERQGISAASILKFVEAADTQLDSLHSLMIVRHGQVVAEGWWAPYSAVSRHELYSLSKSFTSTAVGLASAEGKMTVDDSVLAAFPEDAPAGEPSNNLKAMRVRDLLRMSTGHQVEPRLSPDAISAKTFLAHPVPFKPGTHFHYNTPATFMASAMVQKATGQSVLEYLKPRLFEPLGIVDPTWDANFQGISLGGYGLSLKTEDIAKFGQLLLQKGNWKGKQLIPAAWVEEATSRQTSNGSNPRSDWEQGYGYQFWRCRHNAYRGDGAFGQYCLVMPDQDAVVAITSGLNDLQGVLNLIWDKLLPAMQPDAQSEDPEAARKLQDKLKALTIRKSKGSATSPTLAKVAGKTFAFPSNDKKLESARIEPGANPGDVTIITRTDGREQRIEVAGLDWKKGTIPAPPGAGIVPAQGTRNLAATGAWTAEDTYTARVVLYETPFVLTLTLKFAGDELTYDSQMNVRGKDPQLVGRLQ